MSEVESTKAIRGKFVSIFGLPKSCAKGHGKMKRNENEKQQIYADKECAHDPIKMFIVITLTFIVLAEVRQKLNAKCQFVS